MKQLVLVKIVIWGFPPVNKRCLWLKGSTFYYWYKGAWRSIDSNVDIDDEYVDEKVSEVVSIEMTKVLGNAPEEYDTLEEIAHYVTEHKVEAEERDVIIDSNVEAIKKLEDKIAAGGISSTWEGFE